MTVQAPRSNGRPLHLAPPAQGRPVPSAPRLPSLWVVLTLPWGHPPTPLSFFPATVLPPRAPSLPLSPHSPFSLQRVNVITHHPYVSSSRSKNEDTP